MSRNLNPEELIKRGAKRADGSPYCPPPAPKVEETPKPAPEPSATPPAVVVEAPRIDTEPIAVVLREALAAIQRQTVQTEDGPVKPSAPEAWEFTIERDHMGKMTKVRAVAVSA